MFVIYCLDNGYKLFVCLVERVIDALAMIAVLKGDQPEVEFTFEQV